MNCSEYEELIGVHLDGEMDPSGEEALLRHMEGCARCSSERNAYRLLDAAAAEAFAPPEVDDVAWGRVWQGIRRDAGPGRSSPRAGLWWAAAAAVLVAAVAGAPFLWRAWGGPVPDRLAQLRDGGVRMETVEGGTANFIPVVTTEGDVPVVYVYEVGR